MGEAAASMLPSAARTLSSHVPMVRVPPSAMCRTICARLRASRTPAPSGRPSNTTLTRMGVRRTCAMAMPVAGSAAAWGTASCTACLACGTVKVKLHRPSCSHSVCV